MSLSARCVKSIGSPLYIEPIYDLARMIPDPDGSSSIQEGECIKVRPFHIHLDFLYCAPTPFYREELSSVWRGGIGRVKEPEHPFFGHWLVFYPRDYGQYDFTRFIGEYRIMIGPEQPRFVKPSPPLKRRPDCRFGTSDYFVGPAMIAASQEILRHWEESGQARTDINKYEGDLAEWLP